MANTNAKGEKGGNKRELVKTFLKKNGAISEDKGVQNNHKDEKLVLDRIVIQVIFLNLFCWMGLLH